MYKLSKRLFLILIPAILFSCIRDGFNDCGVYLQFIFNYNMEYADSFDPQVNSVDVYIFDEEGKFLFHRHAKAGDLISGKYMYLNNELQPASTYQVITVGGMSEYFRVTDLDNNNFIEGVTRIEKMKVALHRTSEQFAQEFQHLWFGETTVLTYKADASVYPVYLVRNTNKFNLILQSIEEELQEKNVGIAPYTFEIVTPEGAAYGYNNLPLLKEKVTYHPFFLQSGEKPENLSLAKLNTVRLFSNETDGYQLIIRKTNNEEEVWIYNLMDLLEKTKSSTRPDGTSLPMQEYLDRQGEWNIVILHRGGTPGSQDGFLPVAVEINGWIIWLNNIEV